MNKEQLTPWIEKLTKAPKAERKAIVAEMCKENGLKIGDGRSLLKEAGFEYASDIQQGIDTDAQKNGAAYSDTAGISRSSGTTPVLEKPAKKRVKHEHLKGKKLIVGNKTVEFDADGTAELDAADADRLLTIPDYKEVKE
jgi:hypothetical protein